MSKDIEGKYRKIKRLYENQIQITDEYRVEIVKLKEQLKQGQTLLVDSVRNRRELLIAFLTEYHSSMLVVDPLPDIELMVDEYLTK